MTGWVNLCELLLVVLFIELVKPSLSEYLKYLLSLFAHYVSHSVNQQGRELVMLFIVLYLGKFRQPFSLNYLCIVLL